MKQSLVRLRVHYGDTLDGGPRHAWIRVENIENEEVQGVNLVAFTGDTAYEDALKFRAALSVLLDPEDEHA